MRRANVGFIGQLHSLTASMNICVYKVCGRTHGGSDVLERLADVNLTAALTLEQQLRQEEEEEEVEEEEEEKGEAETEHGPLFGVDDVDLQNRLLRICMRYILTEDFAEQCNNMAKYMKL